VHATLVKRGRSDARCSLEDVQPFRILEVPLWMLDVAVCCKIRSAKVSVVDVESLRELKTLLRSTLPSDLDLATQAQHRYLLNAGGADVDVIEPAEIHSAGVVCSPRPKPDWRKLSPETQQKVLRLLALLLGQQSPGSCAVQAEEGADE
jgi:hypothetical protein